MLLRHTCCGFIKRAGNLGYNIMNDFPPEQLGNWSWISAGEHKKQRILAFWRLRSRWEYNTKLQLVEMGSEDVEGMELVQDCVLRQDLVLAVLIQQVLLSGLILLLFIFIQHGQFLCPSPPKSLHRQKSACLCKLWCKCLYIVKVNNVLIITTFFQVLRRGMNQDFCFCLKKLNSHTVLGKKYIVV
jgi:hypothetical protein